MNFKMISTMLVAASFLVNCGGSKNETVVDDNTILAVRSLEDASNISEDERTQVALLSGDLSTPEKAQLAADNANWMPLNQFSQDDELSFSQPQSTQNVSAVIEIENEMQRRRGDNDNDRRNGGRRNNDRNWRPYQNHQENWNRPYTQRPVFQTSPYWGYSACNNSNVYIYYAGRCVLPYSPYYSNYYWQPRHYYYSTIVYRGYRHNRYNWRGRAHIRLYW